MANTPKLPRKGAVGFIGWLDVNLPPVDQASDHQTNDTPKNQDRDILMCNDGVRKTDEQTKNKSTTHPGHEGNCTQPMTKPIANRLANAPSRAVVLSGNDIGSIRATSRAPNTKPAIIPRTIFDITDALANLRCVYNI